MLARGSRLTKEREFWCGARRMLKLVCFVFLVDLVHLVSFV